MWPTMARLYGRSLDGQALDVAWVSGTAQVESQPRQCAGDSGATTNAGRAPRPSRQSDRRFYLSRCLGRPIDLDNLSKDRIRPLLKAKSSVRWLGGHAFRRGLATNLHALGVDDMTIQRILRHSNVSVTQDCYIKTLPASVTTAMGQIWSFVQ
jgi:integrase